MSNELGADIKEVYTELGSSFSIVSRDPIITGEYLIPVIDVKASLFVQQFQLNATFPYDTSVVSGDIIFIDSYNSYYLVMTKVSDLFENSPVEIMVCLYLCNLPDTACLLRPIEIRNPETYKKSEDWQIVHTSINGLITDKQGDLIEYIAGKLDVDELALFVPKSYGILSLDRIYLSDTDYYQVKAVESHRFLGVDVVSLEEDTRPFISMEEEY